MKRDVMKKWVAALRSGEYTQGKRRLKSEHIDGPRYCCLGVLQGPVLGLPIRPGETYLSGEAVKEAGFMCGLDGLVSSQKKLSDMNDAALCVPFDAIADWIESKCEDL